MIYLKRVYFTLGFEARCVCDAFISSNVGQHSRTLELERLFNSWIIRLLELLGKIPALALSNLGL